MFYTRGGEGGFYFEGDKIVIDKKNKYFLKKFRK